MIRPAASHERATALRLLLGHLDPADRDARVFGLLDLMIAGELDPAGLLVTPGLRGATFASPVAGAGGVLWPPVCPTGADATALIEAGCAWLRERGSRLVQALMPPGQPGRAAHLVANGFRCVTSLVTLLHDLSFSAMLFDAGERLFCEPYDPAEPAAFHATLLRTYEGSLDCPEVSGLRTAEEVVAGHRAQGTFEPANWWLARDGGAPVGVVIQVDNPGQEEREVAYVGVVPEARRRGVGKELMLRVLTEARADGVGRVVLAVDARNAPAWRLYTLMGFEEVDRQQVFLRIGP
ncbi:MAG: GNAT family N-acetyltransferase [Gemmataceae bacterium]